MCYTFNNYPQTMEKNPDPLNLTDANNSKRQKNDFFSSFFTFRTSESTSYTESVHDNNPQLKKVDGCGKKSGLQLIIDSQKMNNLFPKYVRSKGYFVFITVMYKDFQKCFEKLEIPSTHFMYGIDIGKRSQGWQKCNLTLPVFLERLIDFGSY